MTPPKRYAPNTYFLFFSPICVALDTSNVMVKMQVFDLLSAVTLYSELGYVLALQSLEDYQVNRAELHADSHIRHACFYRNSKANAIVSASSSTN